MMKRVLLGLVAGLVLLAGCGGGSDPESDSAHVNPKSGSTHEAILDEREGTKPPPVKEFTGTGSVMKSAIDANCFLLRNLPAEDDKVISVTAPAPEYEKEPPIGGPHFAPPHQQADGAYLVLPEEPATVASLNHGRMAIQYAPDLPEKFQLEMKGLYDTMYGGTLLFPNSKMNYAVAATTWSNGLFCAGFEGAKTLNAIRAFGKATWGKYGGEPVEKFPVEGPTPAKPAEQRGAGSDSAQ